MKLIPDLREFIALLNSENVQYLVIGGWAYNRYAEPRSTGDIDFFLSTSAQNEEAIRKVLKLFGFGSALPPNDITLFSKKVLMLGLPPNRIDLISSISGISFEKAWKNKEEGLLDGLKVWFISKQDLITNKKTAARPKDILDVDCLEKITTT